MLEFPEVTARAAELRKHLVGKRVKAVHPPTKPHKFCWFNGEPEAYETCIQESCVSTAEGFGLYVEIGFDNGFKLCVNDGVNLRLIEERKEAKNYQLLVEFQDGALLMFTVAMYGGIILHDGFYDNEYYHKSRQALSPLEPGFQTYYYSLLEKSKPNLSAKAFLAGEQRFPGIGNGVLQDVLFSAGIHPKRKISSFSEVEKEQLLQCTVRVLEDMAKQGGRDTEKNIFGEPGGYPTILSKNTAKYSCLKCGGPIVKEAYLGGSVYYCPACQPLSQS